MLRLTKERKRKYLSTGISTKLEDWDFNKNQPKPKTPNRELILKLINNKLNDYREAVLEFKAEGKDFTLSTLVERINKPIRIVPVGEYFLKQIASLKSQKRSGYAASVLQAYNSLMKYNHHLNIYFSDIDIVWLKGYELYLREQGLKENTIGIRFRTLRAVYNSALEEGMIKSEYYPFKKYKVSRLHQDTTKRSITKEEVQRIINFDVSNRDNYTQLAIDLFTYSYVMGGINFVDISYLTKDNIIGSQLIYVRRKTKKQIKFPIHDIALKIHEKYNGAAYIFPILSDYHKTEQQKINRIHKVITKVNRALKALGEELNIPITLTTYVARHSFATVLKRSGVSTSIISESLGHSSEKTTQIYLDSFENSQIDEALKNLL
jgi:integrase